MKGVSRIVHGLRRRSLRLVPDEIMVRRQYTLQNGCPPNLAAPRDLSEKLCWLKLNSIMPLQERCADKLAVRDYIAETVGDEYLIPLLHVFDSAAALAPEAVPETAFAAKVTHDSGGVVICRDRNRFDWAAAQAFLRQRMRQNYYFETRERIYKNIVPRLMVEKLLPSPEEGPLTDYKFWCFHGHAELIDIVVIEDGGKRQRWHNYYDRDWTRRDITRQYPPIPHETRRPALLAELIETAERLTAPFPFCRADLYAVEGRVYVGELTFYPSGGYVRFQPDAEERRLGDLLDLSAADRPE